MEPAELSDAELVQRAQAGDLDAFADIVRRHEHRLRAVLQRLLEDSRDVEESVQDSFVQAWRNLDRYRGDAAFFTWLYRIGVNAALARRRRRPPETVDVATLERRMLLEASGPNPEAAAETGDLRARIVAGLAALSLEHREAVVLRDVAGLTNEEVAAALDIGLAAAKSRIHRGRMQLRDALDAGEP
jgi:RNA polymerase sigma-70 factor (ECF subfamily)